MRTKPLDVAIQTPDAFNPVTLSAMYGAKDICKRAFGFINEYLFPVAEYTSVMKYADSYCVSIYKMLLSNFMTEERTILYQEASIRIFTLHYFHAQTSWSIKSWQGRKLDTDIYIFTDHNGQDIFAGSVPYGLAEKEFYQGIDWVLALHIMGEHTLINTPEIVDANAVVITESSNL